ncbi:MAG: hypothetical protein DMF50_03560 [Acidobacteria bacterium]|nr:MAG: hypothetical protein DMF50_03560 [Acidobacteriota bacterium]
MRLLCVLSGGSEHPSSRFRIMQHLHGLRGRGIAAEVFVAKRRGVLDIADLARRARRADLVLLQKKLFPRWKLRLVLGDAPFVFDLDDAVFSVSPSEGERYGAGPAERRAASRSRRLQAILRRSRRVLAGNRYLADYASRFASDVQVLPTAVDLTPFPEEAVARARARRLERRDGARIGWIGSRPSLPYLASLAGPLRAVCARYPDTRLVQICNAFTDLPGVPMEKKIWDAQREASDLMDLDVGLMPLDDTPFSRGKCGLKILQYHAAGVPVICSPVGANRDLVSEGESGLFAHTQGEWEDGLSRLVADRPGAMALGERGRRVVSERFEASLIGSRLADLLLSAAA